MRHFIRSAKKAAGRVHRDAPTGGAVNCAINEVLYQDDELE